MKQTIASAQSIAFSTLLFGCLAWVYGAGPLEPATGPGPTFKTLSEIEPRAYIDSLPHTIDTPGSYYLLTNLTGVAGQNGISITANDVTLDLNGCTITGVPGSLDGINLGGKDNITVQNGTVRQWGDHGIDGALSEGNRFFNLGLHSNTGHGLRAGTASVVRDCIATRNGDHGLYIDRDGAVENCSALRNQGDGIHAFMGTVRGCTGNFNDGDGIWSGGGTINQCTAHSNQGNGLVSTGVGLANRGAVIANSTANFNTQTGIVVDVNSVVLQCTANDNQGNGIDAQEGSQVKDCVTRFNDGDGIRVTDQCRVVGNQCDQAGQSGDGAAIHAAGNGNRIENNQLTDSDRGLDIDGTGNYVARNTVSDNTDNYDIADGNKLNLLLCEIPESIDWPAKVLVAGSLTGASGQSGIVINESGVTIDLGGHELVGGGGFAGSGIEVAGAYSNLTIRGGTIRDWPGYGIDAQNTSASYFEDLRVSGNGNDGVYAGAHNVFASCRFSANRIDGLDVIDSNVIRDCTSTGNGSDGFELSNYNVVIQCTAEGNAHDGFGASSVNRLSDCTASENVIHGYHLGNSSRIVECVAANNGTNGFSVGSRVLVDRCTAYSNDGNGISGIINAHIRNNTSEFNDGSGILITGSDCRVDGNHCLDNKRYGIEALSGSGSLFIRNSASGNTIDQFDFGGHVAGPILNSTASTTEPFANFKH